MEKAIHQKKIVVTRKTIINSLSKLSVLSDSLAKLLNIPPNLFDLGLDGRYSFSSDQNVAGSELSGCFFVNLPPPKKIPEYAIDLSMNGRVLFCTFVDKKRKLIVSVPVQNISEKSSDWELLEISIKSGLREATNLESLGKKFRFVLVSEDDTRVL